MALIKEPYGLVYNTDGTLCTTYRDDVVPFRGVRSFAVETATTNYWNNDITDYVYLIDTGDITFENTVYNGRPALKCIVTGTVPYIRIAFKHSAGNINPGDTYTASIGVAALSSEITGRMGTAAYVYFTTLTLSGFASTDHDLGKAGNRIYATYTHPTNDTTVSFYACVYLKAAGTFYLYDYQLEKKPFASSFVIGSRPSGRLVISVDDLGFNPATDDWVVHYWKYPVATGNDNLNSWNETAFGVAATGGCIWWGKQGNYNRFHLCYNDINNSSIRVSSGNFDPDWYFRNWHSEVILKHGGVMEYWVDGILQCQLSISTAINPNFTLGLAIGGSSATAPSNSYYANVYYGLYTDQWTDEYIREVYEAKIPFSVQNKLSIY